MINSTHLCCGSAEVKLHACPGSAVLRSSMHLISVRSYCEGGPGGHWRTCLPSLVSGHVLVLLLLSGGNGPRGWKRSATLLKLCWRAVFRPGPVWDTGSSGQMGCSSKSSPSIGMYGARVSRSRSLGSNCTQIDNQVISSNMQLTRNKYWKTLKIN